MTTRTLPAASTPAPAPTARPGAGTSPPAIPRRIVAAAVAGNALEFYDFVTYAFFAVYIGRAFFPASTPLGSLLLSVAVFGVGFFSRPLGGALIGAFADRAGRRNAMLLTIALITVGTLGLALTPTYASIGLAAPLIVVACRLVQGVALGGEVGPSSAFLIEAAPVAQRGLYASWQAASQGLATLVAGAIGVGLSLCLSPDDLQAWGWRVPFLLGIALLPLALYLRKAMPETLHAAATSDAPREGIARTLLRRRRAVLLAVLVIIGGTVANYVGNYLATYAVTTLKLPPLAAMGATVMVGATTLLFSLLGGWLSDRFGRKPVMLWPRLAHVLVTVPAFLFLIAHPNLPVLLAVATFLSALTSISGAASMVAVPELFPRGVRASGMAIAYAAGVSVFGGTTQFVVTWLIGATGNPAAPAWYVAGTGLVTVVAILALPETRDRALED